MAKDWRIKNFIDSYISDEDIDLLALKKFIEKECDMEDRTSLYNSLCRNGIDSIDKLYNLCVDDTSTFRRIGAKKQNLIIKLQKIIDSSIVKM